MKKLVAPLLLFVIAGVVFSSCSNSSKLAFTKRHYRSGYFADLGSKNHTAPVSQAATVTVHPVSSIAITKPENPVIANVSKIKPYATRNGMQENTPISITANSTKQVFSKNLNISESPIVQDKQTISESKAIQGDGSGAAGAALSLLWIVIVVILILWLIGLLAGGFGLGGFINLLLLIALILLILWLLRIA